MRTSINPTLFASLETTDSIHGFVFRSLAQIVGDRSTTEGVVQHYFATINSWFTVVEKVTYVQRLSKMWSEPSAEVGLLALAMSLIVQAPSETPGGSMQNNLYLSVKTISSLVATKVPLSASLLQANLLIGLYELCHLMPQQSFLTLGTCLQMSRAFGWLNESFWFQNRWSLHAGQLKLSSILWYAIVYIDRSVTIGFPLSHCS